MEIQTTDFLLGFKYIWCNLDRKDVLFWGGMDKENTFGAILNGDFAFPIMSSRYVSVLFRSKGLVLSLLRFPQTGPLQTNHVWRRRDHSSCVWQRLWVGQGRIRRRWCSTCCLPLHCGPTSSPGKEQSLWTMHSDWLIVKLNIGMEHWPVYIVTSMLLLSSAVTSTQIPLCYTVSND